jgi:hypothetical protein
VNTCGGIFYSFVPEKMPNYIDPKSLGLQPRIVVEDIDGNTLAIVINRKSRIIRQENPCSCEKNQESKTGLQGYAENRCTYMQQDLAIPCRAWDWRYYFLTGKGSSQEHITCNGYRYECCKKN